MVRTVVPEQLSGPSTAREDPDKKRRSSKACDSCRRAKCKCSPALDLSGNALPGPCQACRVANQPCTYEANSKKRGPPKGYIEAVEQRLHRMEALLGGLIENEDPRAQALLGELIGDEEAQAIFKNDLRAAAAIGPDGHGRRSWQSPLMNTRESSSTRRSSDAKRARLSPTDDNGPSTIHIPKPSGTWYSTDVHGTSMDSTLGLSPGGSEAEESDEEGPGYAFGGSPTSPQRKTKGLAHLVETPLASQNASNVFAQQGQVSGASRSPVPSTIPHTGFADSHLEGQTNQLSELADVVGQLSLNEVNEIRYHGRTSGLYLISESLRYKDFFWRFPGAGVWPRTGTSFITKTEDDILRAADAYDALPDQATQDKMLEAYWTWVHPVLPILYRSTFMKQYRSGAIRGRPPPLQGSDSSVPMFLLLAIFALAARYIDTPTQLGTANHWQAGDEYFLKADALLAQDDLGFSRLTTVQGMLLMAYRESGMGAMARSWALVGMAIRMAQDMGLFRDVDRWYMPAAAQLSYEEKQTRKRVWWGCVFLDRYISAFIGRPMAVHERDWDTAFPSESEPDEHDHWRPTPNDSMSHLKSHSISTFNRASSLAVHLGRVIIQLYAIRVRVIGQSSTALLSHLDQQLAKWYLSLPPHLQYTPGRRQPPAVLVLHANFHTTLLLLHRPFTPNRAAGGAPQAVPSHSIATTAANAIANIVTAYHEAYGLQRAMPMLGYYTFTAAVMHVYNLTYDPALVKSAREGLGKCMRALREMGTTWGAAWRSLEVLKGLAAVSKGESTPQPELYASHGIKRPFTDESGFATPVEADPTLPVGGNAEFSFTLEDLFPPAQAASTDGISGATTAASAPNPVFADLLDSFFGQDGGTSGFNMLNEGVTSTALSPVSIDSAGPGALEGSTFDMSGTGLVTSPGEEDWSAYLATLGASSGTSSLP